jgi:hypothetical protein
VSALEAAYDDLRRRAAAADRVGDWREWSILEPLTSVADYTKRVGDHPGSAHYRAGKAGDLVAAALRVEREAFLAYERSQHAAIDLGVASPEEAEIDRLARLGDVVATVVRRALWATCMYGPIDLPVARLERAAMVLDAAVDAAHAAHEYGGEPGGR